MSFTLIPAFTLYLKYTSVYLCIRVNIMDFLCMRISVQDCYKYLFLLLRIIFNIVSWCSGSCSMTSLYRGKYSQNVVIPNSELFLKNLAISTEH